VLDLPEAIFSNLGLIFLAHTHIPTVWNDQNIVIENHDWNVEADGGLHSRWTLPNGIVFGAHVTPRAEGADLELWLENGTTSRLSGLRTQICAMLKAAPGFEDQTPQGKEFTEIVAVARARDAQRCVLIGFEHCGRAWGNAPCPCIHSDPVLPDVAPGNRVSVRGRVWFYQGDEVETEKKRLLSSLGLAARQ
jgi:hypothetical protein